MRTWISSNPLRAALSVGVSASALYAVLTWLIDDDPVSAHLLEIIVVGLVLAWIIFSAGKRDASTSGRT